MIPRYRSYYRSVRFFYEHCEIQIKITINALSDDTIDDGCTWDDMRVIELNDRFEKLEYCLILVGSEYLMEQHLI